MSQIALFIQSCAKNKRLNVFFALAFLGPLPVTAGEIADFTDINRHTVSDCLDKLRAIGLALCQGALSRTNWQLSPAGWVMANALFSVIGSKDMLQIGQAQALPMAENLPFGGESNGRNNAIDIKPMAENLPLPSGMAENLPSVAPREREINNINSLLESLAAEKNLAGLYQRVLVTGHVHASIAKRLAGKLAEGGAEYMPHLLTHLARAKSGQHEGYRESGVYVLNMAEAEVPAEVLPPADLDFTAALRWAMNGGVTDAQIAERQQAEAEAEAEHAAHLQALAERTPEPTPAPETESPLWSQVLSQLQMEIPRHTFDTWVRETRLVNIDGETYTIASPTAHARDWLENRLAASVRRALSSITGHINLAVRFVVAEKKPA